MSNLIKISDIPWLTPSESVALEAYARPKIKEVAKGSMVDQIVGSVALARQIKGQSADEKDDRALSKIVIDELKVSFTTFTVEEVCLAINMGAKGFLNTPETVHVSAENVFKWIWKYRDQVRSEAISKQRKFEQELEKQQQEEKRKKGIEELNKIISDQYAAFEIEVDVPIGEEFVYASRYRWIVSQLGEQLTVEERRVIWEEAGDKMMLRDTEEKTLQQKLKEKSEKLQTMAITQANQKTLAEAIALQRVFIQWKVDDKTLTHNLELI